MATGANVLFVKKKRVKPSYLGRVKPSFLSRPRTMKFSGEESFIVAGGIPTKQYLLYLGAAGELERIVPVDSLTDSGETVSINPPALPTYDVEPTVLNPPALPDVPPDQGPVLNPPILPSLPVDQAPTDQQPTLVTFPDWPNLSCEGIKAGIEGLRNTLMVSKFSSQAVRDEYERQVALGEKYLTTCETKSTTTTTTTVVTPPLLGGPGYIPGSGFGVKGGGAGADEKKKKPFPWWWIVVGGAVLYYLTREKK